VAKGGPALHPGNAKSHETGFTGSGHSRGKTSMFRWGFPCYFVFVFKIGSQYVAHTGLKLTMFLPPPPEC
jgi:hypothetical protein